MGRHGTREAEVDRLLRGRVLVDLLRAVRQGLRASVESYSIKKLEPLYGFQRSVGLRSATGSLQRFEVYLAQGTGAGADRATLEEIEGYNRDDCLSAWRLRDWLEQRRQDLELASGQPIPRPQVRAQDPSEAQMEDDAEVRALTTRLTEDLPDDPTSHTDEQSARRLLAYLLGWHRREDKSTWWDYFHHLAMTDEELVDDGNAIANLEYVGITGKIKRSNVHRYRFPPQDHNVRVGSAVRDVRTEGSPGEVVAVDDESRTIDLKRGVTSTVPHPSAIMPFEIVSTREQQESLRRVAAWVIEHGMDAPEGHRAARDLLLRRAPRVGGESGAALADASRDPVKAARHLATRLDHSVLPAQGPPGSGKTHTGAQMIVELLAAGRKVGVTANSHKVICNLLDRALAAARKEGVHVTAVQKVTDEKDGCQDPAVILAFENSDVLTALQSDHANLAAGTAWLWSRQDMGEAVDVLVIDEAGQISLANAIAVSQAARSVVLLGDPQQLNQPQKGIHPPGVGASALEHVLQGAATISTERGIFLAETRRLHPDICAFTSETFYEGKLHPMPGLERQALRAAGGLTGTGLRFVPVEHQGNQSESAEEVDAIVRLHGDLLGGGATWTDEHGSAHQLTAQDILVVAPYNAQVAALRTRLGTAARVGTVDKFQGQEAPVVICSMTTSTAEEAPRGMEFLYNPHRLNVATSRARCLAVLVASPDLVTPRCRTPWQIQLANAFCRFLELATIVQADGHGSSPPITTGKPLSW